MEVYSERNKPQIQFDRKSLQDSHGATDTVQLIEFQKAFHSDATSTRQQSTHQLIFSHEDRSNQNNRYDIDDTDESLQVEVLKSKRTFDFDDSENFTNRNMLQSDRPVELSDFNQPELIMEIKRDEELRRTQTFSRRKMRLKTKRAALQNDKSIELQQLSNSSCT